MITFPNAKINLGLNIVEKRIDGYHNLETIFYPVQIEDALEIKKADKINTEYTFQLLGNKIEGNIDNNLVIKAYRILKNDYELPPIDILLYKKIPSGAGLGGGSSDAAFMLKMLNENFNLQIKDDKLEEYASKLGADCAFFIKNSPVYATGIGNIFENIELSLSGYQIIIVKPNIFVSTKDAFSLIAPAIPEISLKEIIQMPIELWSSFMRNDFETSVFSKFPEIKEIKELLYSKGAVYASMSGSGSSLFGIFKHEVELGSFIPDNCFVWRGYL